MPDSNGYDVIIIGAGYAGLSAAALLSRQGNRVLVLERAGRLGGRAGFYEKDGFVWEYGQHSCRLGKDGIAARVFDLLGRPLKFADTRGHRAYLYFEGKLYPRPEGAAQFLFTRLLPLKARLNFLRFYARLLKEDPNDWYDRTLLDLYRTWYGDPRVERFLSFLGLTVMVCDPGRVSAGEVIQFLKRATKASVKQGEPLGGVKQIIDTLADVTRRQGGEIHVSESAMEILTEGRTAVGVRTHVAAYRARAIVFAAPLFRLFTLIREDLFSREFANYVKGIKSSRGLTIDFVSREPLADIQGGIVGVEVPLWVKFQSNADPSLCPQGSHVCTWGLLFDPDEELTTASVERTEAHIKRIVEEVFPGALAKVIQERRLVVPVLNGAMLIPRQSYPHRPDIVSTDVARLYFIGDTTRGEGCSGDIAFSSAIKLAALLQGRE